LLHFFSIFISATGCLVTSLNLLVLTCRDVDSSNLVVKPAFSTAALAAVPVSTGSYATHNAHNSSSSSSGSGSSGKGIKTRQVVDLLILQPGGKLILHRGSSALVMVRLLLPHGHLQHLQQKLAAAAAMRQHYQQQLQLQGSPMFGAAGAGLLGGRVDNGVLGAPASVQGGYHGGVITSLFLPVVWLAVRQQRTGWLHMDASLAHVVSKFARTPAGASHTTDHVWL
jgi:hypothetical protein